MLTFLGPRYVTHFDGESTEYDTEFDWSLDKIEPWPQKKVARLWNLYAKRYDRYHKDAAIALCAFQTKRDSDKEGMYLHFDGYYIGPYDEMHGPDGCLIRLCSTWTETGFGGKVSIHPLLEARDDHNNHNKALAELKARAIREYNFTPEEFDALPHEIWGARRRQALLKKVS